MPSTNWFEKRNTHFFFSRAGPSHSDRRHDRPSDRDRRQSMGAISMDRYSVSECASYVMYIIFVNVNISIWFDSKLDHRSHAMNFTLTPDPIQAVVAIAIWMEDAIASVHNIMVQTHRGQLQHPLMTSNRIAHRESDVAFQHVNRQRHHGKIANRRAVHKIMAISIAHCCDDAFVISSRDPGNLFRTSFNKHLLPHINSSSIRVSFIMWLTTAGCI